MLTDNNNNKIIIIIIIIIERKKIDLNIYEKKFSDYNKEI